MTQCFLFLQQLALPFVLSSTVLLALGALVMSIVREPAAKQRIGELAVLSAVAWLILSVLPFRPAVELPGPMDRLTASVQDSPTAQSVAAETVVVANTPTMPHTVSDGELDLPAAGGAGPEAGLLTWPVGVYLIGCGLLATLLCLAKILLGCFIRGARPVPLPVLNTYATLDVRRPARVVACRRSRPFSCGLLKPTIVVPESLCQARSVKELKHVLLHEQAHIERYDAIGHAVLNLALPVLYFHPLYWLLRHRILFNRELLADAWASRRTDRLGYVRSLTQIARLAESWMSQPVGVMGMADFHSSFGRRMHELIQRTEPIAIRNSRRWQATATAAVVCLTLGCWAVVAGPTLANDEGDTTTQQDVDNPSPPGHEPPEAQKGDVQKGDVQKGDGAASSQPTTDDPLPCLVTALETRVFAQVDGIISEIKKVGELARQGEVVFTVNSNELDMRLRAIDLQWQSQQTKVESDTDVKYAETELTIRRQQLRAAEEANTKVQNAVGSADLRIMESEVRRAEVAVEQAKRDRQIDELQLKALDVQRNLLQQELSRCKATAPVSGVVTRVDKSTGEFVSRGDSVCLIQPMEQVVIRADIKLDRYRPELKEVLVRFTRGTDTIELTGQIEFVEPQVSTMDQVKLLVKVENRRLASGDWSLIPGMVGQLVFLSRDQSPAGPER